MATVKGTSATPKSLWLDLFQIFGLPFKFSCQALILKKRSNDVNIISDTINCYFEKL
jgi:hypothetical protein